MVIVVTGVVTRVGVVVVVLVLVERGVVLALMAVLLDGGERAVAVI